MSARVLVLSGGAPQWTDPWHPFEATSERVAEIAAAAGFTVDVSTDVAGRLADLDSVDVLVVNAPDTSTQREPDAATQAAAAAGLERYVARSAGALAIHAGVTGLAGIEAWHHLVGARWVEGRTGHPPLGACTVLGRPDARVPTASFDLIDERYTDLAFEGHVAPLIEHEVDGGRQPLVWAREVGGLRIVADTLGHDERSFDSPEHRELLARCLRWVARIPAERVAQ